MKNVKRTCTIIKEFDFCAGHNLPDYAGPCNNPHGHNFHLIVSVSGPICEEPGHYAGMVMEYADLSNVVKKNIVDVLDHQYINKVMVYDPTWIEAGYSAPTTECVAWWMYEVLHKALQDQGVRIECIELRETPKNSVKVTWSDWYTYSLGDAANGRP